MLIRACLCLLGLMGCTLTCAAGAGQESPADTARFSWRCEERTFTMPGELVKDYMLCRPGQCSSIGPLGQQVVCFVDVPRGMFALKGTRVFANGVLGPRCDEVVQSTLKYSPDDEHYFYVARIGKAWYVVRDTSPGPAFDAIVEPGLNLSPDGGRFAYTALRGKKTVLVVDGVSGGEYDRVYGHGFTNNGRHLLCLAAVSDTPFMVVDGVRQGSCGGNIEYARVDETGSRVACVVKSGEKNSARWWVVVDGVRGPEFDEIVPSSIAFSRDGRRAGYVARSGQAWQVVLDGVPGPAYEKVKGLEFSDDGQHVVYGANRGKQWCMVRDGVEGPWFDFVGWFAAPFSPDGRHTLYLAQRGGSWHLVHDDDAGPAFTEVGRPIWSRTGAHYASVMFQGERACVVVDGRPGPLFDGIGGWRRPFSPDGNHFGHTVHVGKQRMVVVDSTTIGPFESVGEEGVQFSPDSRHWAVTVMQKVGRKNEWRVVLDGAMAPQAFDGLAINGPAFLPDGSLGLTDWPDDVASRGAVVRRVRYVPTQP